MAINASDLALDVVDTQTGGNVGNDGSDSNNNGGDRTPDNNSGDDKPNPNTEGDSSQTGGEGNDNNDGSSTGGLEEGDTVEFENATYTVDKDGNLVAADGTIFKEAKDVKAWLDSQEVDDNNEDSISLENIQKALGEEIVDENGKPVEFTNDADGVKAYVESVINLKSQQIQDAAINKLYSTNPWVKRFVDYVELTGSPKGFGDIPDRSGIEIDKNDIAQQKAIIKMAANEFGNKSLDDNYIKYLEANNGLYDVAKSQLEALVEKDKRYIAEITNQAEAQRKEAEENTKKYWDTVNNVIDARKVGGYKLPDNFAKDVDGKKVIFTIEDFKDYVSKPNCKDENGNDCTGYQKDLNTLTQEAIIDRDLLDAWLMFTKGTYKDLIDMAMNEDKVKTIRVISNKTRTNKTIKINKPTNKQKVTANDLAFD